MSFALENHIHQADSSVCLLRGLPLIAAQAPEPPQTFVPEDVVRITMIESVDVRIAPFAVIEVTGTKPINAVVVVPVNIDPWPWLTNFTTSSFPGHDRRHGESVRAFAPWLNPTLENTRVAAVIFSDGSSLGSHRNPATRKDVVQEMFDFRAGAAAEWSRWSSLFASMPSDPHMKLHAYFAVAGEITEEDSSRTYPDERGGRCLYGWKSRARPSAWKHYHLLTRRRPARFCRIG